jgi:hypothetical protein
MIHYASRIALSKAMKRELVSATINTPIVKVSAERSICALYKAYNKAPDNNDIIEKTINAIVKLVVFILLLPSSNLNIDNIDRPDITTVSMHISSDALGKRPLHWYIYVADTGHDIIFVTVAEKV